MFIKIFAINESLLPQDPKIDRFFQYVTLEVGLAVEALLPLGGLVGSIAAFLRWSDSSFGALDPSVTLRIIIPSGTALILSFETVLASFFLSVLGLKHR